MAPKISQIIGCPFTVLVLQLSVSAILVRGDVSHLGKNLEYTITPSSQVAYYHYPAPSRSIAPTRRQQQVHQPSQHYHHQQQQQQPQSHSHHQVAREFAAPALEHAAFTQALTSHGYVFGGAAASAPLASVQAAASVPAVPASVSVPPAVSIQARSIAPAIDSNSLNLKLPVPFGLTPLNVAQLPLQAGAPYASVPHTTGLTSYGTPQIQRR